MNLADIPNYGEKDEDTKAQHVNKLLVDTTMNVDDTIGYTRFRENSLSEVESKINPPEESDIARFCKESKYGYSFTPISPSPTLSTYSSMTLSSLGFGTTNATSAAAAAASIIGNRRKSCDRGLLCFLKIRNRLNQLNAGRRFSQPDFGIIDKQRSRYEMLSNHHPHNRSSNIEPIPEFSILTPSSSSSFFKHHEEEDDDDDDDERMPINHVESSPDSPILWSQDEYRFNSLDKIASEYNNDNNSTLVPSIRPIKKNISSLDMSFTKSTPVTTTTTATETNDNDNENNNNNSISHFTPSSASRYLRALHYPTRFLPQQQAILTTDVNGKVLLFNDISSLCFGIDQSFIGQSLFTKFDHHTQHTMKTMLQQRKQMQKSLSPSSTNNNNSINDSSVLVCGGIIPIIKGKGKKATAASLWLKERWNNNRGKFIYLWVFEEIYESRLTVIIDSKGHILDTSSITIYELYGYQKSDVIGQSIKTLLPSINITTMETNNNNNNELKVNTNKFYTSKTKSGSFFPSMVHLQNNKLLITSLPTISGLITIHRNGMIQSMNPVPAKYLFGYKTKDAVETIHIDKLLPQFMTLVQLLADHHLLHYNRMVSSEECIELLQQQQQQQGIIAIHHDGNQFNVKLQIRLIESDEEDLYSVWITYNRISTTKTIETTSIINTTNHYRNENQNNNNNNNTNNNITKEETTIHLTKNLDKSENNQFYESPTTITTKVTKVTKTTTTATTETTASIKIKDDNQFKKKNELPLSGSPQISRISCFGSVPKDKALFPMHREEDEEQDKNLSSSSPPPQQQQQQQQQQGSLAPIIFPELDDYVIMGSLGEGAYGSAKLVHLRSDPKQEFVIKAIVKSRIVIDSWVRDRKYGSIPIEIHILLKLQQHQHMNCPRLVNFIEDDDNYYTITQLHGDGMDLFDYIELNENIPEQQVRNIFYQAVSAVQHLHHLKIVHRDIKDENILLDEHGVVQLIDFGSAAYFREGKLFDTFSGTLDYCAPEILNGNAYAGPPQDVWCLGILLYTLIYRETPFYSVDDIMERKLQLPYLPFQGKSRGVVDLIYKLLDKDYQQRPTIDEIMEDKWLLQKG